jgi:hypothetical protein
MNRFRPTRPVDPRSVSRLCVVRDNARAMSLGSMKKRTAWARRAVYAASLMIGTGLLLAGCGGGGGGSTSTSQALSKQEFTSRVFGICGEARKSTAQFRKDYPGPHATPRQAQQYFKEVAPASKQAADAVAALPAPTNDNKAKALQDAFQKGAREIAAAAESPAKAKAELNKQHGDVRGCAIQPPKP